MDERIDGRVCLAPDDATGTRAGSDAIQRRRRGSLGCRRSVSCAYVHSNPSDGCMLGLDFTVLMNLWFILKDEWLVIVFNQN